MPEGKHNSKGIVNMNKYPRTWGGMQYAYILSMHINVMCYLLDIGIWNPINEIFKLGSGIYEVNSKSNIIEVWLKTTKLPKLT